MQKKKKKTQDVTIKKTRRDSSSSDSDRDIDLQTSQRSRKPRNIDAVGLRSVPLDGQRRGSLASDNRAQQGFQGLLAEPAPEIVFVVSGADDEVGDRS